MIIDGRGVESNTQFDCDICIVGAGAAGITLARELQPHLKIVLIESGDMRPETAIDRLNQGEVRNESVHGSLQLNRCRQLGGTTALWGGRCVPFDDSDFEARSHVPYSGWCIRKSDLVPYYQRAHAHCEIGSYSQTPIDLLSEATRRQAMIPGLRAEGVSSDELYLFSPPTNFGQRYLSELRQSDHITLFLQTTCLSLNTTAEGTSIDTLQVASLQKNQFSIRAKQFVLAAGGLEVTRLLLLSNQVHLNGIGNQHDLVGRFYMSHINHRIEVQFSPHLPIVWDYEKTREAVYCQRSIALSADTQRQHQLLNHRMFVDRPDISNPTHKNGIFSATYLVRGLLKKQLRYSGLSAHSQNILLDLPNVAPFSYKLLSKRVFSSRKLPSVISANRTNLYTLRLDSEQAPNPSSRVMLSQRKDCFGLNQLKVDWRFTEQDIQSIETSIRLMGEAFARCGVGKISSMPVVSPAPQGGHYLGTTRMSDSSTQGVVDRHCQVHGVSNLFIASSSVFPTASYANPTLTIVALAIRLADRLKQTLSDSTLSFAAEPIPLNLLPCTHKSLVDR